VNDVRKVLVWTDADIDAGVSSMWTQFIDDMLVGGFVRDEIIRIEIAFRLRPIVQVTGKLIGRDLNIGRSQRLLVRNRQGQHDRNDCDGGNQGQFLYFLVHCCASL